MFLWGKIGLKGIFGYFTWKKAFNWLIAELEAEIIAFKK